LFLAVSAGAAIAAALANVAGHIALLRGVSAPGGV